MSTSDSADQVFRKSDMRGLDKIADDIATARPGIAAITAKLHIPRPEHERVFGVCGYAEHRHGVVVIAERKRALERERLRPPPGYPGWSMDFPELDR